MCKKKLDSFCFIHAESSLLFDEDMELKHAHVAYYLKCLHHCCLPQRPLGYFLQIAASQVLGQILSKVAIRMEMSN